MNQRPLVLGLGEWCFYGVMEARVEKEIRSQEMETMSINNSFSKLDYSVRVCNCDVETCTLGFRAASAIFQWKESHRLSVGPTP